MPNITLKVSGEPIAKKRPRFVRRGKFVGTYNCQDTEEGKFKWDLLKLILPYRDEDAPLVPSGVPVSLSVTFFMPIPASMSKKQMLLSGGRHIKKPDTDNLLKFLKDCGNGVLWADDSQVWQVHAEKVYSAQPCTEITVRW